jgi:hypothetical protein
MRGSFLLSVKRFTAGVQCNAVLIQNLCRIEAAAADGLTFPNFSNISLSTPFHKYGLD